MTLSEQFELLTSNTSEHDRLYESDNLYIVWSHKKQDPKLDSFINSIDKEYYNWRSELKGSSRRESKIVNETNTELETQGYLYSVNIDQMDLFEKVALMPSMKYSYRFEKFDVNELKAKEQQELIEILSEENE